MFRLAAQTTMSFWMQSYQAIRASPIFVHAAFAWAIDKTKAPSDVTRTPVGRFQDAAATMLAMARISEPSWRAIMNGLLTIAALALMMLGSITVTSAATSHSPTLCSGDNCSTSLMKDNSSVATSCLGPNCLSRNPTAGVACEGAGCLKHAPSAGVACDSPNCLTAVMTYSARVVACDGSSC